MKKIVILIPVAPVSPYPALFRSGPQQTWLKDLNSSAKYYTYSGKKMSARRKAISDLRDCIRFPGRLPKEVGTTNPDSRLMRIYAELLSKTGAHLAEGPGTGKLRNTKFISRLTRLALKSIDYLCIWTSQISAHLLNNKKCLPVMRHYSHLESPRLANMTNHLRIQRDVLKYILSTENCDAILMSTTSVFFSWKNFKSWLSKIPQSTQFASGKISSVAQWSYSGTVSYFNRQGAQGLVSAKNLNFGELQDLAIGRWLVASGLVSFWSEIPAPRFDDIEWDAAPSSNFPKGVVAVICTAHGMRNKEESRMKLLHEIMLNSR